MVEVKNKLKQSKGVTHPRRVRAGPGSSRKSNLGSSFWEKDDFQTGSFGLICFFLPLGAVRCCCFRFLQPTLCFLDLLGHTCSDEVEGPTLSSSSELSGQSFCTSTSSGSLSE